MAFADNSPEVRSSRSHSTIASPTSEWASFFAWFAVSLISVFAPVLASRTVSARRASVAVAASLASFRRSASRITFCVSWFACIDVLAMS